MESYMATVQSGQERKTQKARREPKVRTDVRVKVKATVTCVVSEVPRINTDEQTATSASQAVFFFSCYAVFRPNLEIDCEPFHVDLPFGSKRDSSCSILCSMQATIMKHECHCRYRELVR
jgi:hypothetical protein